MKDVRSAPPKRDWILGDSHGRDHVVGGVDIGHAMSYIDERRREAEGENTIMKVPQGLFLLVGGAYGAHKDPR